MEYEQSQKSNPKSVLCVWSRETINHSWDEERNPFQQSATNKDGIEYYVK